MAQTGCLANSLKNSIATLSVAGETVTTLWITLAASTSNGEFWFPCRVASPEVTLDRWAASQSARMYGAFMMGEHSSVRGSQ